MLNTWSEVKAAFPTEVRGEYIEKFNHPDTVHAICEEFRASPTFDYQQDEADRGTARFPAPCSSLGASPVRSRKVTILPPPIVTLVPDAIPPPLSRHRSSPTI